MAEAADFRAAARRHLEDGLLLDEHRRLANAGQLYGFCAECAIKAILVWHGLPTDEAGSVKDFRFHIDAIVHKHLRQIRLLLDGRSGPHYLALIPGITAFDDWRIEDRYRSGAATPSLETWRRSAIEVGRMLDQAWLDGKR